LNRLCRENPYSYTTHEEAILINAQAGRSNAADRLLSDFTQRIQEDESLDAELKESMSRQLSFLRAYAEPDFQAGTWKRKPGSMEYADWMIAVSQQDYEFCLQYLNRLEEPLDEVTLAAMALVAYRNEQPEMGDQYLNKLLALAESDPETYPSLKTWFIQKQQPSLEEVTSFLCSPENKRLYVALLAESFPDMKAALAPLQKQLNYDPNFPARLLSL